MVASPRPRLEAFNPDVARKVAVIPKGHTLLLRVVCQRHPVGAPTHELGGQGKDAHEWHAQVGLQADRSLLQLAQSLLQVGEIAPGDAELELAAVQRAVLHPHSVGACAVRLLLKDVAPGVILHLLVTREF